MSSFLSSLKLVICSFVLLLHTLIQPSVTITVWVHGTNPPPAGIVCNKYSPLRSWLYASPGLSLACSLPENYYFHKLAKLCHEVDCKEFCIDHFYTYGWPSTVLSPSVRKKAGIKLFHQLNLLLKQYRQQFEHIKLRVVGFSHGGNVILNMISCLPFMEEKTELEIILLAVPVQELTKDYINSPWITRAYSFYADNDWIQVMDMQKLSNWNSNVPWFSTKKFNEDDQVLQIKLIIDGKSIGHRQYRKFNHFLPQMLQAVQHVVPADKKNGFYNLHFFTRLNYYSSINESPVHQFQK